MSNIDRMHEDAELPKVSYYLQKKKKKKKKRAVRIRVLKCYVWSTLLYGCEAWTLTSVMIKKIEAFETWLYRKM